MQQITTSPPIVPPTLNEYVQQQIKLNALVIDQVNRTLTPIFEVLNHAPTINMCGDVTRILINFGLMLCKALADMIEGKKPDSLLPEETLKTSTMFASTYGSPIIGGLTAKLDLQPHLPGGRPPFPAIGGHLQEVSARQGPSWREIARVDLAQITEDLASRGFERTTPQADSASGPLIEAYFVPDPANPMPVALVTVRLSTIEAQPFVLEIAELQAEAAAAPQYVTLVRTHSTTHEQLLRTVDVFLAGAKTGVKTGRWMKDMATKLKARAAVFAAIRELESTSHITDEDISVDFEKWWQANGSAAATGA